MGGGASKGKRGPVASKTAKPGKAMNRKPIGFDKAGEHPQNKGAGNKKMNRMLSGADKSKAKKGVLGAKSLEGRYF